MALTLLSGEPVAEPWRVERLDRVVSTLLAGVTGAGGQPVVLAVDGRSGSGKSTLANRIATLDDATTVVRTDDIAWWESFFGWDELMRVGVLEPTRSGQVVCFRPPAWEERGRSGAVEVPAGTALLVVEGVGASRRSLAGLIDAAVWVQSDEPTARRRGVERDGDDDSASAFWDEWQREEVPFLADDRPWARADLVVCGTPASAGLPPLGAHQVAVGRSLRPR